jgi:hypothetical protein
VFPFRLSALAVGRWSRFRERVGGKTMYILRVLYYSTSL